MIRCCLLDFTVVFVRLGPNKVTLVLIPLMSKQTLPFVLSHFFSLLVLYTVFITYPSSARVSREDGFEIYWL